MRNTTSLNDKESLKNLDASQAHADNDGVFDCILNKNDNDNQSMTYRMHILILNETPRYCLLSHKSNGQSIIESSGSNIDLVKSKFYSLSNELTGNYWNLREKFVKTPDHYVYAVPTDLNSPTSSEEQHVSINQINNIPNVAPVNCKLFLAGYNGDGELYDKNDLNAYENIKGFELLTIDKLNYNHDVDNKYISIGYLIEESSSNNNYGMHNCSTLAGSSGAVIVDSIERLIGIHIGIANARISRKNELFYTQDTFNKFIHIHSTAFNTFIHEAIIPNSNNDQLEQKWKFV
ncbi:unnamed protein product [Rotaria magnacalcarata]